MLHKEIRFIILFLPFIAIISASVYQKIWKRIDLFILIILLGLLLNYSIEPINNNPYFTYFEDKSVDNVLITHPLTAYYTESESTMMYYPWFNSTQADYWLNYIKINTPEYIAIDTCEGGFICPPDDLECINKQSLLINQINQTYSLEFYKDLGKCKYYIYKN